MAGKMHSMVGTHSKWGAVLKGPRGGNYVMRANGTKYYVKAGRLASEHKKGRFKAEPGVSIGGDGKVTAPPARKSPAPAKYPTPPGTRPTAKATAAAVATEKLAKSHMTAAELRARGAPVRDAAKKHLQAQAERRKQEAADVARKLVEREDPARIAGITGSIAKAHSTAPTDPQALAKWRDAHQRGLQGLKKSGFSDAEIRHLDQRAQELSVSMRQNEAIRSALPRIPAGGTEAVLPSDRGLKRMTGEAASAAKRMTPEQRQAMTDFSDGYDWTIRASQRGLSRSDLIAARSRATGPGRDHRGETPEQHVDRAIRSQKHLEEMQRTHATKDPTKDGPLYRGMNVSPVTLNQLLTKDEISLGGMSTSTSTNLHTAARFSQPSRTAGYDGHVSSESVILSFRSVRSGNPNMVSQLSHAPDEREVVIPSTAGKFRVVARRYSAKYEAYVVELEEQ